MTSTVSMKVLAKRKTNFQGSAFIRCAFFMSVILGVSQLPMSVYADNKPDVLSYAMGFETGGAFKAHSLPVNANAFAQGLQDGLKGNPSQYTSTQMQNALSTLQGKNMSNNSQTQQTQANDNLQKGQKFLADNASKPGVQVTPSGLQYKVLQAGNGQKPVKGDTVTVDYEGYLIDGKVFDSSYRRGTPISFGVTDVIMGWQEALQMMPQGSVWEVYIPSQLAYGERGAPGAIGPNETLIFKIHLIAINPKK